ncbi:MAG: hypothetical protein K6F07_01140 [Bacilli bacterium]|nr:hypothetical protein [Bacilli bacterium]
MFKNLTQPLNITLTILVSIAIAWVAFLIVDLLFVAFFHHILKKHTKGMTVVVNAKYENIKKIYALFTKYDVPVDGKILQTINTIDTSALSKHDSKEGEDVRNILSYLKDEANFIANRNKEVLDKPDFQMMRTYVNELDVQYRSNIAMYNADVLGYNYWISFLPCRFVFKIFKVKKKNIIA